MNERPFLDKTMETYVLSPDDATRETDRLHVLKHLLLAKEEMYPNIDSWFRDKVVPGISSGSRTASIGFLDGEPLVAAVLKHGKSAKFCHLNISKQLQGQHIGELFFCLLLAQVMARSQSVHFTLPESLWATQSGFFKSFGFRQVGNCSKKYRHSERELVCSAEVGTLLRKTTRKLSKLKHCFPENTSAAPELVFSLKPEYVHQILAGRKTVELRTRFSKKHTGRRIALYATSPVKAIVGEATISSVENDDPDSIWESRGNRMGCSYSEFKTYVGNRSSVHAIDLVNVEAFDNPIGLSQLNSYAESRFRPPQSYAMLSPGDDWSQAMGASRLLQQVSMLLSKEP